MSRFLALFLVHPQAAWRRWALTLCCVFLLGSLACTGGHHGPPDPVITRFQADQPVVETGAMVLLDAQFAGGTAVLEPGGQALSSSGQVGVSPSITTTYSLTVTDPQGRAQVQRQITVTVKPGLAITVTAPLGGSGAVTVTGPEGYTRTLAGSAHLPGLIPGEYAVTAAPVSDGIRLVPVRPTQRVQVTSGTAVTVHYLPPIRVVYLPGGTEMDFVLVPPGDFMMGTDHPEPLGPAPSSSPAHPVTLAQAFYMAKFPTTQAQWRAVLGPEPFDPAHTDRAVRSVSFEDLERRFLPTLNRLVEGYAFRLPSEAEWEYACRGGTTTPFYCDREAPGIWDYVWPQQEDQDMVGRKRPNPWGLYDLIGPALQWCSDDAHGDYRGAPGDGGSWLSGEHCDQGVLRGFPPMGQIGQPWTGTATQRWSRPRNERGSDFGFRLVLGNTFAF